MTPTQAQTEAAADAFYRALGTTTERMSAALTAAAEVGSDIALCDYTIERCAQVARSFRERFFNHPMEMADAIAAAIRKLKNEKAGVDPNLVYPGKDAGFVFPEE